MKTIVLAFALFMSAQTQAETIYRATIDIGGRKFHDLIAIDNLPKDNPPGDHQISGTFTVPGVFTVPTKGFFVGCLNGVEVCKPLLNIDIEAVENGNKFKVFYRMELSEDHSTLTGLARLENGSVLGPIEGLKIFEGRQ
jgi:hypothetical protein